MLPASDAKNNVTHCVSSFPKLPGTSELNLMLSYSNYFKSPFFNALWFPILTTLLWVHILLKPA